MIVVDGMIVIDGNSYIDEKILYDILEVDHLYDGIDW